MFKLIDFFKFRVEGPHEVEKLPPFDLKSSHIKLINQCCGARLELAPTTYVKSIDLVYYPFHTRGIRCIPGKIDPQEVYVSPQEKVVEVFMDGNTMTFICTKQGLPTPKDKANRTQIGNYEQYSGEFYKLTENENDVTVIFPYFSGLHQKYSSSYPFHELKAGYPRVSDQTLRSYCEWFNNRESYLAKEKGYKVFIITNDQLTDFEQWVKKYKIDIVFEELQIHNNNYSDGPRLNLFVTYTE